MTDEYDESVELDETSITDPDGHDYYVSGRYIHHKNGYGPQVTKGLGTLGVTLMADTPEDGRLEIRKAWRDMACRELTDGHDQRERAAIARQMRAPDAKVKAMLDEHRQRMDDVYREIERMAGDR